jgi:hypothetical protein
MELRQLQRTRHKDGKKVLGRTSAAAPEKCVTRYMSSKNLRLSRISAAGDLAGKDTRELVTPIEYMTKI